MDVRQRIVDEATTQFMKFGVRSVTMDEISTALGMSKKTLYQFFKDKDALVWACIEEKTTQHQCHLDTFKDLAADPIDLMLRINQYFNMTLAAINPLMLSDLKRYHPKAWVHFKEFRDNNMREDVHQNLTKGVELGLYRADLNIRLVCRFYSQLVDMVFDPEQFPLQDFTRLEVRRETIMIYLYGIATDKGRALIDQYIASENS